MLLFRDQHKALGAEPRLESRWTVLFKSGARMDRVPDQLLSVLVRTSGHGSSTGQNHRERRRIDASSTDNEAISFDAGSWVPSKQPHLASQRLRFAVEAASLAVKKVGQPSIHPALPAQQHATYNSHVKTASCPSFSPPDSQ